MLLFWDKDGFHTSAPKVYILSLVVGVMFGYLQIFADTLFGIWGCVKTWIILSFGS
jgi:hypothetical protein